MGGFAEAIGLSGKWPIDITQDDEMSVSGALTWARAYFTAAELLHFSKHNGSPAFTSGPVMQNVGLATELTLKVLHRGWGKSSAEIKKYNHNTYGAYLELRQCFDEAKFINLHMSNTMHLSVPEAVKSRLTAQNESSADSRWRVYFDHLRLLDSVYDRPFQSRYITPGLLTLPDTEVLLIGTKLLLMAMEERLPTGKF